ncbi:MarR family winged helix-turn-helix transcriptional regulator [Brachybacterium saurashtrense]|uniref:MarR family transcriptional regulator n=1 Tax=Brachybacterium saurashtrense TaxID=556288 RepID=A0A345YPJ1_9MICO|nr:MarR family transcriptional regulator [Brachybacterium saurashtrense]AXK45843.1 MarR family transcriptional regulator [Brachybacterium saurashtrense]RRR24862.1 MarR family transcriptional regulator [Brachybacterium saurashtrense]
MHTMKAGGAGAPSTADGLWLSGDEQEAWRTYLYATTLLADRFSEALQSDPEIALTLGEYEILVRLSEAEDQFLRMSELADKVVHSRSRLTHTVSRMEKRGLVERVRCAADGRGRQAQLTREGREMLERAAPVHVRSVRTHLLDVIGHDDLLELGRILGRTLDEDAPIAIGCPAGHGGEAAPR